MWVSGGVFGGVPWVFVVVVVVVVRALSGFAATRTSSGTGGLRFRFHARWSCGLTGTHAHLPCLYHGIALSYVPFCMASGYSVWGGRGRCYGLWQEFCQCMAEADDVRECTALREDYEECLLHRKEFRRWNAVARELRRRQQAGEKFPDVDDVLLGIDTGPTEAEAAAAGWENRSREEEKRNGSEGE